LLANWLYRDGDQYVHPIDYSTGDKSLIESLSWRTIDTTVQLELPTASLESPDSSGGT